MIDVWAAIVVLGAIGIVAWPLLVKRRGVGRKAAIENSELSDLLARKDSALFAINELESDYETGSLSRSDYQELRNKYEDRALSLIRTTDQLRTETRSTEILGIEQDIEERVSRLRTGGNKASLNGEAKSATPSQSDRTCRNCGAPANDRDIFCSQCGSALERTCPNCAATVSTSDLFCGRCGTRLTQSLQHSEAA